MKNTNYKTFRFNGLLFRVNPSVYDPAEDTFMLIESVSIKKDESLLDIGCGCGIIGLTFAKKGANVVCTDINPVAVANTRKNYKQNQRQIKKDVKIIKSNLFSALKKDDLFDTIIFNPPYLPTEKKDKIGGWFNIAVDGGKNGLSQTFRFINGLKKYLKADGFAYFVFSSLSNRGKLHSFIKKNDFSYNILKSYYFDNEKLDVYRLKK